MALEMIEQEPSDAAIAEMVKSDWSSIPKIMLTLVQIVNLDSAAAMYTPMITYDWKLVPFFLAFWLVVSITLMNLVTATIVEGALKAAEADTIALKKYRE